MRKNYISILSNVLFIVYASLNMVKHGADVLSILIIVLSVAALIIDLVEVFRRG